MRHRLTAVRPRRSLILPLLVWVAAGSPAAAQNNPFNSDGFPAARGTYGSFPYEQVDPLSGNLIIAVTDLAFPGPIPLTVSRSYNSKFHKDFEHNDQSVDEWSSLGVGWRMHFGRVRHAESTTPGTTVIEGTDGGGGALYQTADPAFPEGWITKGFVRYDRTNHKAKFPNGQIYTFGHIGEGSGPRGQVRYLTEIRDQFNNTVTFHYEGIPGLVTRAHQVVSATQSRDVYFVYNANGTLTNIQYGDRVWTFQHDPAPNHPGHTLLRKVIPPAGLPWEHQYGGLAGLELTALIAPGGGRVNYTYDTKQRRAGSLNQDSRVVLTRAVGGRAVTPGTWTFKYNQGANLDTTVVECPCGTTSYRYNGIGINSNFSAWASGTLAERQVRDPATAAVLEQETFTYGASVAVSPSAVSGEGGQWGDPAVYNTLTVQRVLTRSTGGTWTTTFEYNPSNYNDFGRPFRTTEQGALTRISAVTFQYGFTPWIIGRVSSTSLRVLPAAGSEQTSSTTYNLATGFVTSSTTMGVTTTFTANPNGTVASATNANNHTTHYLYNWGVLAETRNPILWTARGINPDGTVASELVGNDPNPANNLLTTYTYDEVGRLRYVQPRNANFIRYTYEDTQGNLYVQVDRGASQVWTHLDGFGRPIRTFNSLGVQTRTTRDGCGRVVYASAAYTTGDGLDRGTTTLYDWLGRVKEVSVTDPSGTPAKTTYTYTGTDVAIADALGRTTTYHHSTFGGPGDGRLMSVVDAAGVTTSYQYDMFGNLTQVNGPGPGVPPRTWSYHPTNGRLQSDTQPESGPTSYTYDALGNLKTVTDAAGRITRFTYDADERLIGRTTDNDPSVTTALFYDLVGRVRQQSIEGVVTTYTFDNVGRVASKTDGIYPNMSFTSNYTYDDNDNLTQIRYPCVVAGCTQRFVTYQYDVENRLMNVLNNGAAFASNFTYDAAGRLATYQTGAVTHRFDYDVRDRIKQLRAGPGTNYGLDLTYSYDKVSQVTGIVDGRPGMYDMSQSFGYDPLYRLTGAAGPWGLIQWSYDNAGNRTSESRAGGSTTYNYSSATNRLTSTTGNNAETFTYTPVGEVQSDAQGTYQYMSNGMLKGASRSVSGMSAAYLYDASLLRVKRVVNNAAVITVRGAGGQVLSEISSLCGGALKWERDNIYAGSKLLGAVRNGTEPHRVEFQGSGGSIDEGFGVFGTGVRITTGNGQPLACPVTVSYEYVPGTATPSTDFTSTNGTLTFAAGATSGSYLAIGTTLVNDAIDEGDETFWLQLTGAVGAELGTTQKHVLTIADNDPPPTITISDTTVNENDGHVWFWVQLSAPSAKPVSFRYSTQSGSAVGGTDFVGRSDLITVEPGASNQLLSVQLVDDALAEPDEVFYVSLSEVTNATVGDGQAGITIKDDLTRVPIDPSLPGQYFADVESSSNEGGWLQMFNPHPVNVVARVTVTFADGHGVVNDYPVLAQSRADIGLQYVPGVGDTGPFSVAVQSTDAARPLVSEHSGYSSASTFAAGRNDQGSTPAPTWYFGEGVANGFFAETLTVFNPTNGPVTVTLQLVQSGAAPLPLTVHIMQGPGRATVNVNSAFPPVGDHGFIVSAVAYGTSTPANIAVQRTLRWPSGGVIESSTTSGTSTLTNNWYFGDGGKGFWSTYLAFINPSATETAEAFVFYVHDNGSSYGQPVSVPPLRRVSVSPPPGMPEGGFAMQVGSSNLVNYVVERSMYAGTNFALGSASTGADRQAYTWRFAEAAANGYFDTFFLVFNPSWTTAANVTMTFRKTDGTTATHSLTIPSRQRAVVAADALPGIGNNAWFATEVSATNGIPIVVERQMFWPQAGWAGSHSSMGRPQ